MSSQLFQIDLTDLKRFANTLRQAPHLMRPATANVLTSLAFKTREYDIQNLSREMTIRNPGFMRSSLRVDKAQNTRIENQVARAYSINRPRFTGWQEQQTGKPLTKHRAPTLAARGGNIRNTVMQRARFKYVFYKPEQFQAKTRQRSFYFMMRVLASRGGGEFLLTADMPTKGGHIPKGLWQLKNHRLRYLQKLGNIRQPRRYAWRDLSLHQLRNNNNIGPMWQEALKRIAARYKH